MKARQSAGQVAGDERPAVSVTGAGDEGPAVRRTGAEDEGPAVRGTGVAGNVLRVGSEDSWVGVVAGSLQRPPVFTLFLDVRDLSEACFIMAYEGSAVSGTGEGDEGPAVSGTCVADERPAVSGTSVADKGPGASPKV